MWPALLSYAKMTSVSMVSYSQQYHSPHIASAVVGSVLV